MSENWEKLENIFHHALGLPFGERRPFLVRECAGDRRLISEVESLIESFESEGELLDTPLVELALDAVHEAAQKDLSGVKIGIYEIGEKIGAGGMGEVYKAFDTRLNRTVALKFLSAALADDQSAKRRFVKEAQAAAALEHPNICAVHGIEQQGEHHFIVMQYVEGATLGESFAGAKIGAAQFKSLARQIVTAVAFAHAHGILHRDLKPGNIMLDANGQIKILDFGLAKVIAEKQLAASGDEASRFSTNGLIVGTVSYMSPEQLRGEKLDFRSDIFSVGVILYSLLANKNPFSRPSQAATIAAILSENPAPLAPDLPENLTRIVEKCLNKDAEKRFQSAAEILVELDNAESRKPLESFIKRRNFWLKTAFAAVILLAVLGMMVFYNAVKPKKTLAILPISIENSASNKEYLADGLTQSITDNLFDLSELKVKNQSIVARYKGKIVEAQDAGKELEVDAVLVGSIKSRSDGLYLETKIIRTSDGILVDKADYKLDESRLIELQQEVANRIINKVRINLSDEDKIKLARKDTSSEEAKNLYLQGRYYLKRKKDGTDVEKAAKCFFDAKEIDQNFAKAWAGLADSYLLQAAPGVKGAVSPEQAYNLAKLAANRAIELDNTLAESYHSLGLIALRYEWNWREAEGYFRTAIERDPEFLPARFGLIKVLGYLKRNDAAIEEALKIREYDPLSVTSDIQIALVYYKKGDYGQAEKILSDLLQRFPDDIKVKYAQSYQYLKMGNPQKTVEMLEPLYKSAREEDRVLAAAPLGFAYAKTGRRDDALTVIKDLKDIRKRIYVPVQEEALIYVGLGEYDKAFENLKQSCAEKFSALPNWITDPIVEEIQTDRRFDEIKKCVNL